LACVVNWFASFGYFDDEDNRKVLSSIRQALRSWMHLAVSAKVGQKFGGA
jgi:hypothetical protein